MLKPDGNEGHDGKEDGEDIYPIIWRAARAIQTARQMSQLKPIPHHSASPKRLPFVLTDI
jgi:hypothetical protein